MDNLLHYPQSTIVNRVVPKTMFYKFMEVNPRMKVRFVNDVVNITWLYKLSAATLNVTDREDMREREGVVVNVTEDAGPTEQNTCMDNHIANPMDFPIFQDA